MTDKQQERNRRMNRGREAFTLIELLIVIAIICIIAAILFPAFASAREKARSSACMSNMSQLGKAFMQYTQDYDECYPYGVLDVNTASVYNPPNSLQGAFLGGTGWAGILYPYVKATGTFTCPDDPTPLSSKASSVNATEVSYAFNSNIGGSSRHRVYSPSSTVLLAEVQGAQVQITDTTEGTAGYTKVPTTDMLSPTTDGYYTTSTCTNTRTCFAPTGATGSTTITEITAAPASSTTYVFDANVKIAAGYIGFVAPTYGHPAWPPTVSGQTGYTGLQGRHTGGGNYLCADGHAKWLLPTAVSSGINQIYTGCPQDSYEFGIGCSGTPTVAYAQSQTSLSRFTVSFSML